jgi:hypothetical protein
MRRTFALVLLVLMLPLMAVSAQSNELLFNLTPESYLDVSDLGFRLYYPEGWIFDNTQGITLIEDEADVAPLTDGDDSTEASGRFIRILGVPASSIEGYEDVTLEAVAEDLLPRLGGTETERVEAPVLGRRALMIFADADTGRAGILTIWKQPDYMVVATLSVPNMDTLIDHAFSWGFLMGIMEPLGALPLAEEPITLANSGLTVRYPEEWTLSEGAFGANTFGAFELASDAAAGSAIAKGYVFAAVEASLETIGLEGETALTDYAAGLAANQGLGEATPQEYLILNHPAITYEGQADTGEWGVFTAVLVDETMITLVGSAPTEEAYEAFRPTWTAIVKSVAAVE